MPLLICKVDTHLKRTYKTSSTTCISPRATPLTHLGDRRELHAIWLKQKQRDRTRSRSRRRSGRSSTWLCHRCCTLPVGGCRLQVASCNLKDVAFAAHLTPKSQNENGTRPRLGQGHKQQQLQEGGRGRRGEGGGVGELAVRTGNLLHNKLVQCAITRCRDSLPRLPQGCSATLSEQQKEQ